MGLAQMGVGVCVCVCLLAAQFSDEGTKKEREALKTFYFQLPQTGFRYREVFISH